MTINIEELRRRSKWGYKVASNIVIELLDRLEAAERERDEFKRACFGHISDNSMLRAKIEAMEQQEPVMWANSSNINSSRINKERGGSGDQHTCSETQTAYHHAPLYALPGAKGE